MSPYFIVVTLAGLFASGKPAKDAPALPVHRAEHAHQRGGHCAG